MDAAFRGRMLCRIKKLLKAGARRQCCQLDAGWCIGPLHRAIEEKKTAPAAPGTRSRCSAFLDGGADPTGPRRLRPAHRAATGGAGLAPLRAAADRRF